MILDLIDIDPKRQRGDACVKGTRINARYVYELYLCEHENFEKTAQAFEISIEAVQQCRELMLWHEGYK